MTIIKLESISYNVRYFSDKRNLFDRFNVSVNEGEVVFVTGPSGSGKTTLLYIIGTLIKPDEGNTYLFGERVSAGNIFKMRKKIGYVFQTPIFLENATVEDNILFYGQLNGLSRKEALNTGIQYLEEYDLLRYMKQKPRLMSGGERQRLALILPLMKNSELIIADEPLGSIDPENREKIFRTLTKVKETGKTMIIASHDPSLEKISDKSVFL